MSKLNTKQTSMERAWLRRYVLVALCVAPLANVPAFAQPAPVATAAGVGNDAAASNSVEEAQPAVPLAEALNRRGDLTLRGNSLSGTLMTISELWQINIVAGEVSGSVNGVFKDAPLREILDSVLISNGYGYRAVGESLVVTELAKLGQVNPFFESSTVLIQSADVNEVVAGAQLLSTPGGQVRAIPSASSIFVLDFPDRVKMISDFAASVDIAARRATGEVRGAAVGLGPQQLQVAYLKTHFIEAEAAERLLKAVLSPVGRIATMDQENRLLAVDYAENLQMVSTVLARIDRPQPQVAIRALIYDISLSDMESIGLNWQSLSGGDGGASFTDGSLTAGTITSGTGSLINSLTVTPPTADATNGTFSFFTLNSNVSLGAVAVALQEASDSRLLASPNVTVIDNVEAEISSVEEIPFQQLTQTAAGGNIGTTAFREAGVKLRVRPQIAMDGTIKMQVEPEFSRLTGFTATDNQPIIDRRKTKTDVRVANGQTFVIAGLRQRTDVGDFSGVPLLKDVRFFGHLFRGRDTEVSESELVVFISPVVVTPHELLSPRQQATADTIDCRLDRIPQAEGCMPGCGDCGSASPVLLLPPTDNPPTDNTEPCYPVTDSGPVTIDDARSDARYPLRPDYGSRFRATGGTNPVPQKSAPTETPEAETANRKGLWRRFFR